MATTSNRFPLHNAIKKILDDPNSRPELPGLEKDWLPHNWLASIPDSKKLSELTIPGTHDSCTYTLKPGEAATPITRTQRLTLEQQLNAGIRFLDIRCRHIENAFAIHHDRVYLRLNFDDVLKECTAFLTAHQSECIVMSVKNEHTEGDGITRTYEATFDSYLQGVSKEFWYLGDTIPNLKDVRGKIVLLRRFGLDERLNRTGTKGIDASAWPDNTTFEIKNEKVPLIKVQDQYKVESIVVIAGLFDVREKWNRIKDLLDEAQKDKSQDHWYINFTSGASVGAYPNAVAGRINDSVSAYVEDKSLSNVRLGTIVTDFPDDDGKTDMVDRIIGVNFR